MDDFRSLLYYPLGLLPNIFFSLRFFIQWTQSERSKRSYVTSLFWKLSLAGNILAIFHYLIQFQCIFLIIQVGNAFISSRNLRLINKPNMTLSVGLVIFIITMFLLSLSFGYLVQLKFGAAAFLSKNEISFAWNLLGAFGGALFAGRFWIQWWDAELRKSGQLNEAFWVLSIVGGAISVLYSFKINDTISMITYSTGMVPYVRNLMLLMNTKIVPTEK